MNKHFNNFYLLVFLIYLGAIVLVSCENNGENVIDWLEEGEEFSGGAATVFDESINAFGNPAPNLRGDGDLTFITGNSFFNRNWVTAPASTEDLDGLGPLFNSRSCSGCHFKDGKGRPPLNDEPAISILFRLSVPGKDQFGGPVPAPHYGLQLGVRATLGTQAEGNVSIQYEEINGKYADGESYQLRKPTYQLIEPGYGEFPSDILISPRVAPHMVGLGLLAAIDEKTILSAEDPDDSNKDGISGKANWVWDFVDNKKSLGRFGWKANQPTLLQQTAGAFNGDIGMTSHIFPDENTAKEQLGSINSNSGGSPELKKSILDKVAFYSSTLAVPKRRNWKDTMVLRGKQLFLKAKCNSCHTPKFITGSNAKIPEFSNQTIRPFTDLLLHDMGELLADGRPDYEANGREWRTPPLWGIGLIETVNGHTNFLHDGRARNLEEAILWHGGEGEASKNAFIQFEKSDREALISFLNSL